MKRYLVMPDPILVQFHQSPIQATIRFWQPIAWRGENFPNRPTGCPWQSLTLFKNASSCSIVRSLALDRVCGFLGTGHPASRYYWCALLVIASILLRRTLSMPTLVWWLRRLGESSTCASLKRSLLSSIRIERIILGLRSCVTHRNRAVRSISIPWGGGQTTWWHFKAQVLLPPIAMQSSTLPLKVSAKWLFPLTPILASICGTLLYGTLNCPSVPPQCLWMLDLKSMRLRSGKWCKLSRTYDRDWRSTRQYLLDLGV